MNNQIIISLFEEIEDAIRDCLSHKPIPFYRCEFRTRLNEIKLKYMKN